MTSGARLMDSTPPATTISASPGDDACEAETTADRPDAQSRFSGDARDRVREAGQQGRHARDVAVVLSRLVGTPEVDVVDRRRVDARSLDSRRDRDGRQIVRANVRERPAVAADGRPDGGENDGSAHADDASGRSRS